MDELFFNKWHNETVTGDKDTELPDYIQFKNTDKAISMLKRHIDNNSDILIHCDIDFDGIGTAYITSRFLINHGMANKYKMAINKDKVHGIAERHVQAFNNLKPQLVIILDSSCNELEYIKRLNCDVLIIDHHEFMHSEFTGNTANGEYVILSNMVDNGELYKADDRMSCGLVSYELFRIYCKEYSDERILYNSMLYQWVGITLFTDAITLATDRNQWYIEKTVHSLEVEKTLGTFLASINTYKHLLDKSFINFSLVPLINKAIRAGHSNTALDIAISKPYDILKLAEFNREQQLAIEAENSNRIIGDTYILNDITNVINEDGKEVSPNYAGVIAIKLVTEHKKNCVTYKIKDGIASGSFRGRRSGVDYRQYMAEIEPGIYAQGHKTAFGFKVKAEKLEEIMRRISEIEPTIEDKLYLTAGDLPERLKGKYHIESMEEFKKQGRFIRLAMANSRLSSDEILNIVVPASEVRMVKTTGKLIIYDVMGIQCKAFEQINSYMVDVYMEYTSEIEVFVRNHIA